MNDSLAKSVGRSRRIKGLPKELIVPKEEWDSYYHHFTFRIRTLSEFIDIISRLSRIIEQPEFGKMVYRGHSDASSNYRLVPTIGRKQLKIERCENDMITEMLTLRPEEFNGIQSNFDLLSKLQHFGIPTRLLDFTYNPLIALYFACQSSKKTDGRVLCTFDTTSPATISTIETICGMFQYIDYNAISLDRVLGDVSFLPRYAINTIEPLMARPKYSNDRIKHQAAVFMIFPNDVYDYRSQMVVEGKKIGDENKYRRFELTNEEEKRLDYVRKEPDIYDGNYYVNSKSMLKLFRYYDSKFDVFYNDSRLSISEKYSFLFRNRFSVLDQIHELSDEIRANSFVSILIEARIKKQIIRELEMLGIDKAFVFPELEYTAETVRNKLF